MRQLFTGLLTFALTLSASWAQNRIDTIRADAPALAAYGSQSIGVRSLQVINPNQIDMLKIDPKAPKPESLPRYNRPLTLEVWYPAAQSATGNTTPNTTLRALVRDGKTEVGLQGRAVRDAAPSATPAAGTAYPLVIISHGFPGNRFLLAPIAENIASKGYVVASIDHTDSTYDALGPRGFASTLVNRPLDQLFVLNAMAKLAKDSTSFLFGQVDTDKSAVVGYSMGGYGALIAAGAGVTQKAVDSEVAPVIVPHGLFGVHVAGSASQQALFDKRIKTIVAIAPWGHIRGVFDAQTVSSIKVPGLWLAGSVDDVSGYDNIRATWQGATGVDRTLLTFENANHNAAAPMPPPLEAQAVDPKTGATMANHYIDAVWDNVRMNNISQHYITAWLGKYLKADEAMDAYFDPVAWKGFPPRTAKGLKVERLPAGR
jgi:predicted dienelactone hydrolase